MSQRFSATNYRHIAKVARKLDFYLCRQAKGSHEIWRRDSDGRQATLVNHGSKDLKIKTVKAILDDLGITLKKFLELS